MAEEDINRPMDGDTHARYYTRISDDMWVSEDFNNPGGCGLILIVLIISIVVICEFLGIEWPGLEQILTGGH